MKIFRNPTFFGLIYIGLIPAYAILYTFLPAYKDAFGEKPLDFIQSIYFSIVTITTLGFGDISPKTDLAQITTASEVLLGVIFIGLFLNSLAQLSNGRLKNSMESRIVRILERIFFSINFTIEHGTYMKISQEQIRFDMLTVTMLQEAMKGVFFSTELFNPPNTVGQSIASNLNSIQNDIEQLISLSNVLDPELVDILSKVDRVNERWLKDYQSPPIHYEEFNITIDPQANDISNYAHDFHELHIFYRQLYTYQKKHLIHNPFIRYRLMGDNIVHLEKYSEGVNLAKKLLKNPIYRKDALFLSIVAYTKLDSISKAKKALRKYVEIGPEDALFVRQNLENSYKKQLDSVEIERIFEK